jgi:hypothetical protein
MKNLFAALVAGVFAVVAYSALAADPVKTDPNPGAKPGRAIDDGTVKAGGNTAKPGRAADEEKPAPKKSKKKKKKDAAQ